MSELLSRMQRSTTSQLALCVAGIMGSLILYSLLQVRVSECSTVLDFVCLVLID